MGIHTPDRGTSVLRILGASAIFIFLCGCAAQPNFRGSEIEPAALEARPAIVVVRNEGTKEGFLDTIGAWLTAHGYSYTVVPEGTKYDLDKLTLEYTGFWRWDMRIYLDSARIDAFHSGQKVGRVEYKVPAMSRSRFSVAAERVDCMMATLFGRMSMTAATERINDNRRPSKRSNRKCDG
jgi:hypothetical protein